MKPEQEPLPVYAGGGVLPMVIANDDNGTVEVITCESISGGADYVNNMPRRLTLMRCFGNTEIVAEYLQTQSVVENNFGAPVHAIFGEHNARFDPDCPACQIIDQRAREKLTSRREKKMALDSQPDAQQLKRTANAYYSLPSEIIEALTHADFTIMINRAMLAKKLPAL